MVVAIDGPAGAGKSTVARYVSRELGFIYLNSGNLYRAVVFLALENGIIDNKQLIITSAQNMDVVISDDALIIDGRVLSSELRTDQVDAYVASVSSIPELRDEINSKLRQLSINSNVIVEGRDMTTVVFPDAEQKFYLDASLGSRAERRHLQGTSQLDLEKIKSSIEERDKIDKTKVVGSLKIAEDAHYLDSTGLTIEEVCAKVVQSIQGYLRRQENSKRHGR